MKLSTANYKLPILLTILAGVLFLPLASLAQGLVPCGPGIGQPCQFCHLFQLFKNIVDFLLIRIVPVVAVLMIVIGGFMYVFAYLGAIPGGGGQGGPALLSRARSLFTYTIVGLIVIYASWLIINVFFQVIGVADWTGLREGWWRIDCPAPGITITMPKPPPPTPTPTPTPPPPPEPPPSSGIFSPINVDPAFSQTEADRFRKLTMEGLDIYTDQYRLAAPSINILSDGEFRRIVAERRGGAVEGDDFGFSDHDGTIYINGSKWLTDPSVTDPFFASKTQSSLLTHEMAHSAMTVCPCIADWVDMHIDLGSNNVFVSGYAQKGGVKEDFAETIVAYKETNGDVSKITSDPAAQKIIQQKFDFMKKNGVVK